MQNPCRICCPHTKLGLLHLSDNICSSVLCLFVLPLSLPKSLSVTLLFSTSAFKSLEMKKVYYCKCLTQFYIPSPKMWSWPLKYLWYTHCLLFAVRTPLDMSRAFSKLNNAVWCDMIIALFQQPVWRVAGESRCKVLIIKSPQQQGRTLCKQLCAELLFLLIRYPAS